MLKGFSRIVFKKRLTVLLAIFSAGKHIFKFVTSKKTPNNVTNKYLHKTNTKTSFAFKHTGHLPFPRDLQSQLMIEQMKMIYNINQTTEKRLIISSCLKILFLLLLKSAKKTQFAIKVAQMGWINS